jgi:hypothetical protein
MVKPQTSNLKPQTSNLKPQTSNLKPQTSNLKPIRRRNLIKFSCRFYENASLRAKRSNLVPNRCCDDLVLVSRFLFVVFGFLFFVSTGLLCCARIDDSGDNFNF